MAARVGLHGSQEVLEGEISMAVRERMEVTRAVQVTVAVAAAAARAAVQAVKAARVLMEARQAARIPATPVSIRHSREGQAAVPAVHMQQRPMHPMFR
jgi:hypothetical protein